MRYTPALLFATLATAQAACPPVHLIYARATTEPPGSIQPNTSPTAFEAAANKVETKGYGAAGYSLFTNMTALIPGATGWPVHYPANWAGCTSENKGISDLIAQITSKAKECPGTKFVLGGHSQGGVVTVRAIPQIPKDILPRLLAVTMFGSPQCPALVKDRCKSYCNTGDSICTGDGGSKAAGRCNEAAKRDVVPELSIRDTTAREDAIFDLVAREAASMAAASCAGVDVESEHGHAAKGASGNAAHMAYNRDGYYVKVAACYIVKKLAASTA